MSSMNKSILEPEAQAILSLCCHDVYRTECPQCVFRAQACIEHLTAAIQSVIDSIDGEGPK